jgi:predicted permease
MRLEPGAAVSIDARVLIAAALTTTATGIAFGLVPAIRLSRARIGGDLAHAGRRMGATFRRRRGQWLVATEIALAVALLAAAGLMTRSFARLLSVDLGFDPGAVIAFNALPVGTDLDAVTQSYQDLLRAVRAVPGVAYAGAVDLFALGGASINMAITVNGRLEGAGVRQVLPGYFEAMGFRLRAGSFPGATGDDVASAAVVNESAARTLFGGDAVGGSMVVKQVPLTVVGVVADVHQSGPMRGPTPEVFVPFVPVPPERRSIVDKGLTIVVRPRPGATNLMPALRAAAASIGPRAIVDEPRRGDAWLSDLVATPRHQTTLVALLGVFGLALTLIGVFSTTAYAVERRTQEIGIRMALGADASSVVRTIVRDAGQPLVIGLAAGTVLAFYATRLVQSFLFQTTPHDPATFAVAAGVLALTAIAAAWWPARRAARIDPVAALRAE